MLHEWIGRQVGYLSVAELPPRPDLTGHPRPPHALRVEGDDEDPDLTYRPKPPPGQGPTLACYRPSQRTAILTGVVATALFLVVFVLGRSWEWFLNAWPWMVGIAVLGGVAFYFGCRNSQFAAGAEWLASTGDGWVRLYELTKVDITHGSGGKMYVRLFDTGGRRIDADVAELQKNRLLWDLTYNGILHSVIAGGARTDRELHLYLWIPYPAPTQPPGPQARADRPPAVPGHAPDHVQALDPDVSGSTPTSGASAAPGSSGPATPAPRQTRSARLAATQAQIAAVQDQIAALETANAARAAELAELERDRLRAAAKYRDGETR